MNLTQCDQCGQVDDHPKAHVVLRNSEVGTWHFDCLSVHNAAEVCQGAPHAQDFIDKAKGGVHGAELRKFILAHKGGDK